LVTSRHSSEKGEEAIKKHPELANDLRHWVEGVYIIVRGSTTEYVQAVNLARPIPAPKIMRHYQGVVDSVGGAIASIEHFIGGPVQLEEPFALVERRASAPVRATQEEKTPHSSNSGSMNLVPSISPKQTPDNWSKFLVKKFPHAGDLYFGSLSDILGLAKQRWITAREASDIKVFWGYASWGSTQLLAEMARRSWGISEEWDTRGGLQNIHTSLRWNEVVDHMSIAKASEYSREE